MHFPLSLRAAALGSMLGLAAPASALEVTSGFSGWWDQPDQEAHGLIVVVAQLADGTTTSVAYWAMYQDGAPSWLIAQGPIDGDTIDGVLYQVTGVNFLDPTQPATNPASSIGTMDITFEDCNSGEVTFDTTDPSIGSGQFPISRLTTMPGQVCSGGISDNFPPDAMPEDLHIDLDPTGVIADADGEAELQIRPNRASFEVEIEQVPDGLYTVDVGEQERGTIEVVDGDGRIRFRSPQVGQYALLDFDPRGQIIDVRFEGDIVLTAEAPEEGTIPGFQHGNPPAFGSGDIEVDLDNLGIYPDGSASAEYEEEEDTQRFEVEVEDIPEGSYALRVGGEVRGTIEVVADDDGETDGEIEFRFPPETGTPVLDFDVLGALVEILEGDTVLFSVEFPLEGDDDDGNGPPGGGFPIQDAELTLDNSGVFPEAEAEAEYERRGARETFEIEVEGLPAGSYPLVVDGSEVGTFEVGEDGDAELAYRRPGNNPAFLPLDFDPVDAPIEIRADDGTVLFTGALTL